MLEAKHISKTFGDRQVLVDVNLQVKQGDVVVILGHQVQEKQLSYVALITWRKQMEVN